MHRTTYDKKAVITDIAEKKLTPEEIADKYGISVGNVYTIKSAAIRAGIIVSKFYKNIDERIRDEKSVFDAPMRERIKDLREKDFTTTEITNLLIAKGIPVKREDVEKVMARGANVHANSKEQKRRHRIGRVVRG